MDRRTFLKQAGIGSIALVSAPALQEALVTPAHASRQAAHVRWDIIHLNPATTPPTISAGGVAVSSANAMLKIQLTGSGTFVAPASGGTSDAVTGGGTWETFEDDVSTGSGTYEVMGLASWQFADFQAFNPNDLIGAGITGANGNAVLRIAYSDGSNGILGIGCEGSLAPEGIQEGVVATKGYFTYWTRQAPVGGVDGGRTIFHILAQ